MRDRRNGDRRPMGSFVTVIFDDRAALCLGTDISDNGVFVRSTSSVNAELAEYEGPIVLQFDLPGDEETTFCAFGRSRRAGIGTDGPGTGVEFTYVPADTRAQLQEFVSAA